MKNSSFRPRYSFKSCWDVITLGFLLFSTIVFGYVKTGFSPITIFGLVIFIPFAIWVLHLLIRRIVFSRSTFYVERYAWPSKRIKYTDVLDIGNMKIKTRNGDVVLAGMANAPELVGKFKLLIEQNRIDQYQIENKTLQEEAVVRKSLIPALVVSFALWGLVLYFLPYHHPLFKNYGIWLFLFGISLSGLVIFLLVMRLTQWIIKKAGW